MNIDFEVPTKGWNARDNMDAMEAGYAIAMNNQVPENGYLRLRGGTRTYQSESVSAGKGATGSLETLVVHDAGGTETLIGARDGSVLTIDSTIAATEIGAGFSNARWQTMMFNGKLIMVNGADDPQEYDGTTLSAITMTLKDAAGVAIPGNPKNTLIGCVGHQSRSFYWADNEQRFFYADVAGGYAGDLIEFPIATRATQGGKIVSIMSYSRDTGSGMDDMLVVHMSTGQALVYSGNDPSTAATWAEVNRYNIGAPVSTRANTQFGGDQVMATYDGFQNLTTALPNQKFSKQGNVGDVIVNAARRAVTKWGNNFGWEVVFFPRHAWLIFNVPRSSSSFDQYVMNTVTGAWFKITGINAITWSVWNGRLMYGDPDGNIMEAETGTYDEVGNLKNPIEFKVITAFSKLGSMSKTKVATGTAMTHNFAQGQYLDIDILEDYDKRSGYVITQPDESFAAVWDVGSWDVDSWSEASDPVEGYTRRDNYPATGTGVALALKIRGMSKAQQIAIYDLSLQYRNGGRI